jgi:hypothetical protein
MNLMFWKLLTAIPFVFGALPATTHYELNSYGFGSGGGTPGTSNYLLEGISGEVGGQSSVTSNYLLKPGFAETQQASVPKISAFDNGSGRYYNQLHFVIDQQSNPSDAQYALQISTTSDFSSNVNYIKSDLTVGPTLALADYQTYAAWGGSGGSIVTTLSPATTYYLRAKATQGTLTESAYGPASSAGTVNPSISFTVSPTSVGFGNLLPGAVTTAGSSISLTFDTNASAGGDVFISGQNGGLHSAIAGFTITSLSGDLSSGAVARGFGAQVSATGQTAGGPLASVGPYNGAADNVGITDSTIRKLISSPAQVNTGTGTVVLKAKSSNTDPSENDYKEVLTLLASASF